MAEKIRPELLTFLTASELPLRILVVESLSYLPELRKMFPRASLYAVAADGDRFERPEFSGLGVQFLELDYLAEPLPYGPEFFDYIISDLTLEQAGNPQDIAAGFSHFLKQTGAFLTSFRNIRHWSVVQELMDGHYYQVVARLFAKPEFEKLLYASYYKDVRVRPQRRRPRRGRKRWRARKRWLRRRPERMNAALPRLRSWRPNVRLRLLLPLPVRMPRLRLWLNRKLVRRKLRVRLLSGRLRPNRPAIERPSQRLRKMCRKHRT